MGPTLYGFDAYPHRQGLVGLSATPLTGVAAAYDLLMGEMLAPARAIPLRGRALYLLENLVDALGLEPRTR